MSNRTASQAVQGAEQCPTESAAEAAAGLVGGTTERNSSSSSYSKEEDERQSCSGKNKGAYRSLDVSRETGTQEG